MRRPLLIDVRSQRRLDAVAKITHTSKCGEGRSVYEHTVHRTLIDLVSAAADLFVFPCSQLFTVVSAAVET